MSLLKVRDLKMWYAQGRDWVRAVDGVSFEIGKGKTLGIIGESGCGKTSLGFSLMRLLPSNGKIIHGEIFLNDVDLTKISEEEMRQIRWARVSMIFQAAMNAFDPVQKVGDQLVEALRTHRSLAVHDAKQEVRGLFEMVGIEPSRMGSYPHEFSGGMRQRAMLAMSLVCHPDLVIADEPTTALDVVVQDQILEKMRILQKQLGIAMILISHDVSVIMETCERTAVMYGGQIVEEGSTTSIFKNPRHPYTKALLQSFPSIKGDVRQLISLPGTPPDLSNPPPACRFEPRCPLAQDLCRETDPALVKVGRNHHSKCHFATSPELSNVRFQDETV